MRKSHSEKQENFCKPVKFVSITFQWKYYNLLALRFWLQKERIYHDENEMETHGIFGESWMAYAICRPSTLAVIDRSSGSSIPDTWHGSITSTISFCKMFTSKL